MSVEAAGNPIHILPFFEHKVKVTHRADAWTLPNHSELGIEFARDGASASIVTIDGYKLDDPIKLETIFNTEGEIKFGTKVGQSLVLRGSEVWFFEAEVKVGPAEHYLGPSDPAEAGSRGRDLTPKATTIKWGQNGEQKFDNVTIHFAAPKDGK
ncbi:uncharacterized protein DFL_004632 [Arthrobotrys flagrans]|uniref:Uncharacterized protein n=1 Tax=Arthrobotrys flagrans TaxID=97331 RepID=A0A437A5R8_ARTFL|nr:hypothetical protein DFL_004632 [Arthrobotrys flagrans]